MIYLLLGSKTFFIKKRKRKKNVTPPFPRDCDQIIGPQSSRRQSQVCQAPHRSCVTLELLAQHKMTGGLEMESRALGRVRWGWTAEMGTGDSGAAARKIDMNCI